MPRCTSGPSEEPHVLHVCEGHDRYTEHIELTIVQAQVSDTCLLDFLSTKEPEGWQEVISLQDQICWVYPHTMQTIVQTDVNDWLPELHRSRDDGITRHPGML